MWPSQPQDISSDSLTTVMVLAQKLKLHNPVLTAAPGMHEEMCLQITKRAPRTVNNSSNENLPESNRWDISDTSTSTLSTLSSACGDNANKVGNNSFLRKKPKTQKICKSANQISTSIQSHKSSHQNSPVPPNSSSRQISKGLSKTSARQRRPLLSQLAVDIDTENDTDAETSNDCEIICTSDDEIYNCGIEVTSNSDYDDAFESVLDTLVKENSSKNSHRSNINKSNGGSSYNQLQQQNSLETCISTSSVTKTQKENGSSSKVKDYPNTRSSITPPKLCSPPLPFRYNRSRIIDLEPKFCDSSPPKQTLDSKNANSPKTHPWLLKNQQISDHQDDGLGASVDDDDINTGVVLRRPNSLWNIRKKRYEGKKSRNLQLKRQGDSNGSDTSNTSSSSSLSYSPFTKVLPIDTSSPLAQYDDNTQLRESHEQQLEININNSCHSVPESTDFGQKLSLLQSELVQLRHHDEKLARQFLQIYRDIQILKVQRACLDHQDLLDDAIDEVEDRDRLLDLCDTPPLKHSGSKLRHCGLTKMNICSRRFSCS